MAGDDDALAQFESTVTSSATKIASLANLAAGPTAVVGFLAEGVFKGIRLGMAINAKAKEINAKLDSTIRARSFIRTPIVLDLGEVDFRNFYENKANIAAFPVLSEMAREIAEFDNTGGLVLPATKAKLQAALVPINDRSLSGLPRSRSAGMTDADQLFVSRSRNGLRGDRSTDEGQQRHVSPKPT